MRFKPKRVWKARKWGHNNKKTERKKLKVTIAKRSHNKNQLSIIDNQLQRSVVKFRVLRELRGENKICKTNPKQTQTKPIFTTPKTSLSPKIKIFDKFMKTFLCKTKPNCSVNPQ